MIHIIFLEPQTPGNVGAIARAMKNFNLNSLIIINPKCNVLDKEAKDRAKHAFNVLEKTKIFKSLLEMKEKFNIDYLVGTTSALGTDYNIPRLPISPEEFAKRYSKISKSKTTKQKEISVGLIIGREGSGLRNEEILECDFVVTIPTSHDYPALNASHAASILFYELFKNSSNSSSYKSAKSITSHIKLADGKDKEILLKEVNKVINNMKFQTESKRETQIRLWKKLIGKSFLTKRESQALIGFIKKLKA